MKFRTKTPSVSDKVSKGSKLDSELIMLTDVEIHNSVQIRNAHLWSSIILCERHRMPVDFRYIS